MSSKYNARRVARRRQRGAAIVEAAVVLPVLAIFLGLVMYEHDSYKQKITVQQTSRRNALDYASHGCQGGQGSAGAAGYSLDTGGGGGADRVLDKGPPGGGAMQGAASSSFNLASSSMSATAKGGGHERKVSGKAEVYCNEIPRDANVLDLAQWAFDHVTTGVL